ncbi:MAG: TetR/AcrR family transcriptional regulator [bacterium]
MARRSDHSREQIHELALSAAERLVSEDGIKALTARKVASEIGYTVGTLYLVFDNIEDLILQLNGRTLDAMYDWVLARHLSSSDREVALIALADAYIEFAEQHIARWNLLFDYRAGNNHTLPEWYLEKLGRLFGLVESTLGNGNSDTETVRAARVLWAGVHGICLLKIRQQLDLAGGQSTREMTRLLIHNFLGGMPISEP